MSCVVGRRHSSDLAWMWLAATPPIQHGNFHMPQVQPLKQTNKQKKQRSSRSLPISGNDNFILPFGQVINPAVTLLSHTPHPIHQQVLSAVINPMPESNHSPSLTATLIQASIISNLKYPVSASLLAPRPLFGLFSTQKEPLRNISQIIRLSY